MIDDRYIDRGVDHRRQVLSRIEKLWEAHPNLSFCDLIDIYVIAIGTMAGNTSDEEVIERVEGGSR